MQAMRSLLFAAIFYPGTAVFVIACFVASLFGPEPMRAAVRGWTRFHYWLAKNLLGIRSELVGQIPPGPYLIAVKHQSMYETIEMVRLTGTPVVVLKHELGAIPGFGWATRHWGVIQVDREAGAKALREMLTAGKTAVAANRPVLIFPEGTRVAPGRKPPLRSGFAGLYRVLGLPVVPIAMNSGLLWGRGLVKHAGTVTFKVGETIPAGLDREEIERRVHASINALESGPEASA
jgi:1-acyl-sn-glycerol-3-phosphate acyltransferase